MPLLIPQQFHRIWLGRKPIPEIFETWWQTWQSNHPGWRFTTWTEDNLPPSRYPELLAKCCHLSQRSNIIRWELLLDLGGVYVDTDFECVKNIAPILENAQVVVGQKQTFEGESPFPGRAWYVSAFAAAVPGHPLFQAMVDDIPNVDVAQSLSLGSRFLTRHALACPAPIKVMAPRYLYPYNQQQLHLNRFPRRAAEFPHAYALHHWGNRWQREGFTPL